MNSIHAIFCYNEVCFIILCRNDEEQIFQVGHFWYCTGGH